LLYLHNSSKNILYGGSSRKVNYQLPKDWEEAKQACLDYWKEDDKLKAGDWVYHRGNNYTYKITKIDSNNFYAEFGHGYDSGILSLGLCRKATPEEIKEALLTEAKKRYPVGTKFTPAHVKNLSDFCIVISDKFKIDENTIHAYLPNDRSWDSTGNSKFGNTTLNRMVYYCGKWAEIIPNEVKLPFGKLTFTINKDKKTATCLEGTITKSEIKQIVDWFAKDFTLLGHKMQIVNEGKWYIGFGCCKNGTLKEAQAILAAFD